MKIKIGKYKDYFGPYQLAEALCFWVKEVPDEYGFKRKPDWVHDFGEWLAYGYVESEPEVGEKRPIFGKEERKQTWFSKLICGALTLIAKLQGERVIKIQIDPWDTWSVDHTLSMIILPMLKQLKDTTHGAPYVDDEDVPDELKSTAAPAKENDWDTDDNHFKRWKYALDEMIWTFEKLVDDDWEHEFYSGTHETLTVKREDGLYEMIKGENDTFTIDHEGMKKVNDRIQNGLRLFAKHYRGLWD
jgi:hypothetical protein